MKRFKALLMSLVLATCMLGTSSSVNAATYSTGKATIAHFTQSVDAYTSITISNITDNPINVTVTLYNMDGTILTDDGNVSTGRITSNTYATLLNYSDNNIDSTLTFTLNPHCSTKFKADVTTAAINTIGYGVISWNQSGNALQGLVANCTVMTGVTVKSETKVQSIMINNGMPF